MASPSNALSKYTGNPLIDASLSRWVWELDYSRTITWSISGGFYGEVWTSPATLVANLEAAFDAFEQYINVLFRYEGAFADPISAHQQGSNINFASDFENLLFEDESAWALGFFPGSSYDKLFYEGAAGDIFLNGNGGGNYLSSYAPGSEGWFLFLHEIGHALGLKHPHDDGGTGGLTYLEIGLEGFDRDWFSIMSYNDDFAFNEIVWDPFSPMMLDVLALQSIYGPNMKTGAGDSVYTLPEQAGYETLWDASGFDTLDLSNANRGWHIELPWNFDGDNATQRAGLALSNKDADLVASGLSPLNLYWLVGDYEAVVGSGYADYVEGSELNDAISGNGGDDIIGGWWGNDTLSGGEGDDILSGGEGFDTATYAGAFANFSLLYDEESGVFTINDQVGSEGSDQVSSVELFSFSDTTVSAADYIPNNPVSGAVVISGDAVPGGTLRASTQGLMDEDGIGALAFQWLKGGEPIAGANGETLRLSEADLGELIQVEVSYTDNAGHLESVISPSRYGVAGNSSEYIDLIEMYILIPGRAPDASGLAFWSGVLDGGGNFDLVANEMWASDGARALYPDSEDTASKVSTIYNNVLNRTPDDEGLAYWVNQWNTRGPVDTMLEMITAITGYSGDNPVALDSLQLFSNKVDVGAYLALHYGSDNLDLAAEAFAYLESDHSVAETIAFVDLQMQPLGQSVIVEDGLV